MASIIRTKIRASDQAEYKVYLKERGFDKIELFTSKTHSCLNIYFEKPAEMMTYTLRGVEQAFMSSRSHIYFYDLEEPFDELGDIFGDEDN